MTQKATRSQHKQILAQAFLIEFAIMNSAFLCQVWSSSIAPSYLGKLLAAENLPNLVLCGIGAWGVVIARRTMQQIKRQTDALVRSQTPYLAASPHDHPPTLLIREDRVVFSIWNKGLTPAHEVKYESWLDIAPRPFLEFSPLADYHKEEVPTILYPNHKPMNINMPYRRGISAADKQRLKDLELGAYIRIKVTYRDAFNSKTRYAEFGYEVRADGLGFLPKYNKAD